VYKYGSNSSLFTLPTPNCVLISLLKTCFRTLNCLCESCFVVLNPLILLKSILFWVVKPCSWDISRCFGATYFLHLQDWRVNQQETCFFWFLASLTFWQRIWKWHVPLKCWTVFELHGVATHSHKSIVSLIVIVTTVITPDQISVCLLLC
jgi:hypothetical protein